MANMRLDKYLTEMGLGTRSEVKQLIKRGRITVNAQIVKRPELKVVLGQDSVCADGRQLDYVEYEYIMLHKPQGCVSATEDREHKTVLDYIDSEECPRKKELFPVGRLDKDTEGLLLLTNDGELAHRLLSPKKHVEKTYFARLGKPVGAVEQKRFEQGLDIGDEKLTLPAKLEITDNPQEVYVTITEGRYHQVKRMFEACDNEVLYLKRMSMGGLVLDASLELGEYRHLTKEEIQGL